MKQKKSYADACLERAERATFHGYIVTSTGRVFSNDTNWRGYGSREMRQHTNPHGYLKVRLTINNKRKGFYTHKLVCNLFHGPKPTKSHEIRHLDGNRVNNNSCNLAWGTRSENAIDRQKHGTDKAKENGKKGAFKLRGSGFGVYFDKRRNHWTAQVCKNRKTKFLGSFETRSQARKAYLLASAKLADELERMPEEK